MLLRYIRYFLAVAEQENFTRAAERLHISQPTLSQQIRQLETLLDTPLFDRSGRKIQLTDAGKVWERYARQAIRELDDGMRAIHDVEDLHRGFLSLAITPTFTTYLAAPLVQRFHERYPGIRINLTEMMQSEIEKQIGEDKIDLGIAFTPAQFTDLDTTVIFQEELAVMVGKHHPLAQRAQPLSLEDFSQLSFILLSDGFATRQHINDYCSRHHIGLRVVIETNAMNAVEEIVSNSLLATILPEPVAAQRQQLVAVPLAIPLPGRDVILMQRRNGWHSAATRAFIHLMTEGK
ncbi:DNA-binding transcriptional dual regulator [Paramixta manurensis]|uniref:DNA-binding transcriptional dual regulator n=1 Tax=Paramixta manurensis TaxID=2740817 RepID=A0A6M8UFE5_9GAMM|nr:DNA-binding transcriptional dual regulator [Erwiniaceae bacterium PD-1]